MINNLQLDIRKEDYNKLSKKLNLTLEESSGIKYIEQNKYSERIKMKRNIIHQSLKFT